MADGADINGHTNGRTNGSTNGHGNGHGHASHELDIVIVGAGISGIDAAYRVQTSLPTHSYTILESRHELGGTWSLFQYPGIRSDSDLYTFGFAFNLWRQPNPIATGASIIEYMRETARKFGIDKKIRYQSKVVSADWSSETQRWRLLVDDCAGEEPVRSVYWAKFLFMGTGYYSYDKPLAASIPGLEDFKGTTIHPQFWPKDLDYVGKKVVVIGSGATAITLLPALVDGGVESVTMLQRSPSYILSVPQRKPNDKTPSFLERFLPTQLTLRLNRFRAILVAYLLVAISSAFPTYAASTLRRWTQAQLPAHIPLDPHFKPTYNPWEQRLCLTPNGEFYKALRSGRAHIATDTIKRVTASGIELASGTTLPADIIVTATGLHLEVCGNIAISIDKTPVDLSAAFLWRASMLSDIPNLGLLLGYVNASWTLGADAAARLLVRIIKKMEGEGYSSVMPHIEESETHGATSPFQLSSSYVKEGSGLIPRAGRSPPWRPRGSYFADNWFANWGDVGKGLVWGRRST